MPCLDGVSNADDENKEVRFTSTVADTGNMNTATGPSEGDCTAGLHCTIIKVMYILDEHGSTTM